MYTTQLEEKSWHPLTGNVLWGKVHVLHMHLCAGRKFHSVVLTEAPFTVFTLVCECDKFALRCYLRSLELLLT